MALTLAGVSLVFAVIGQALGVMSFAILGALPDRIFGVMTNEVLLAIPLFIFMGVMLERSRIAEDLLERMGRLFGRLRGGLGFSVVAVGALLAASTGIVGATAVTMGLIMLPAMLRHGYDPRLAAGTVAASATLAQIIPPSTVLVLLGDQLNNAYQSAQLAKGSFAPNVISVSDLFAGAIVPGLLLVGLYLAFLVAMAMWRPGSCPAGRSPTTSAPGGLVDALLAPVVLIVAVLGSILYGIATPTEAASVGAVGAILLAARKSECAPLMRPVVEKTTQITSMIFLILIGATMFSLDFRALGGDVMVARALTNLPGGTGGAVLAGDAGGFPARLRDGRLRDHLRRGADRRAGAAHHARRRSGLARHHDRGEFADLLHAPAARADAVLSARRRAAADHHAAHLCRHYSVRVDPAFRVAGACGSCRGLRRPCRMRFMGS